MELALLQIYKYSIDATVPSLASDSEYYSKLYPTNGMSLVESEASDIEVEFPENSQVHLSALDTSGQQN